MMLASCEMFELEEGNLQFEEEKEVGRRSARTK